MQEARLQLQATEREAIDYARRNRLIDTGDVSSGSNDGKGSGKDSGSARSITTANLVELNNAFVQARASRIMAEGRWTAARSGNVGRVAGRNRSRRHGY